MPIDQFELMHGAVILKICRNDRPVALTLIESGEHRSAYRINDVLLYIKHSATSKSSAQSGARSWRFTFQPNHLEDLAAFVAQYETYMALVCGSNKTKDMMQIAFLSPDDIYRCLDLYVTEQQTISVQYKRGHSLRVWGTKSGRDGGLTIHQNALEKWEVPGR